MPKKTRLTKAIEKLEQGKDLVERSKQYAHSSYLQTKHQSYDRALGILNRFDQLEAGFNEVVQGMQEAGYAVDPNYFQEVENRVFAAIAYQINVDKHNLESLMRGDKVQTQPTEWVPRQEFEDLKATVHGFMMANMYGSQSAPPGSFDRLQEVYSAPYPEFFALGKMEPCNLTSLNITQEGGRKTNLGDMFTKYKNYSRDEVIECAKSDFREVMKTCTDLCIEGGRYYYTPAKNKVHFNVSRPDRTVTCEVRERGTDVLVTKAVAKCRPGDVFNSHIGMIFALYRALQYPTLPPYLQHIPEPSGIKQGDRFVLQGSRVWRTATNVEHDRVWYMIGGKSYNVRKSRITLMEDSRDQDAPTGHPAHSKEVLT